MTKKTLENVETVFVTIAASSKYDEIIFDKKRIKKNEFIEVSSKILDVEKFKEHLKVQK